MNAARFRLVIQSIVTTSFVHVAVVIEKDNLKGTDPQGTIYIQDIAQYVRQLFQSGIIQYITGMDQTFPGVFLLGIL